MKQSFFVIFLLGFMWSGLSFATEVVGMANPASVKCTVDGGTLTLKSDAQGSQYGECRFLSGKVCEEWAYFRGECNQDIFDSTQWTLTSYNNQPAVGDISFASGMLSSHFCNTVTQGYTTTSYTISSTGNAISTLMACTGLSTELDMNFDLSQPAVWTISGNVLTLTTYSTNRYLFYKKAYIKPSDTSVISVDPLLQTAITWAYSNKMTIFDTIDTFGPTRTITRQEAAKMISVFLTTVLKKKVSGTCSLYKDDTSISSGLKSSVYTACKLGIMNGYRGLFNPQGSLIKSHTLSLLMRARIGKQDESQTPRRQVYADKAIEAGYLSSSDFTSMDTAITRGELILWMYKMK